MANLLQQSTYYLLKDRIQDMNADGFSLNPIYYLTIIMYLILFEPASDAESP